MVCTNASLEQFKPCENHPMFKSRRDHKRPLCLLLGFLVLAAFASAQDSKPLVKIERMKAELDSQSTAMSNGRNSYEAGFNGSQQMNVQQYPNTNTCLVVYPDGKYFVEKKDERTPGKPKVKSASGVLSADELQQFKAVLDEDEIKKITMPKDLVLPDDATGLKEAERVDVQVHRETALQQFTFMKERISTGPGKAGNAASSLTGMDVFLDNGAPYKKTVAPLMKWFDELSKKNKFQDSKPQYCQ